MKRHLLPLLILFLAGITSRAEKPTLALTPTPKGIEIDAGSMGKFFFPVSSLIIDPKDYNGEKPAGIDLQGDTIIAHYPSGATLKMAVSRQDKSVAFSFEGVPATASSFVSSMYIPINFSKGGRYAFNANLPAPFPEEKGKQIIADAGATRLTIIDAMDSGFSIQTPENYQQLQDNRVFNWATFVYNFYYTFKNHPGQTSFVVKFEPVDGTPGASATGGSSPGSSTPHKFLVDRFGQSARKDYPTKVKTDDELKQDVEKEKAATPKRNGPAEDIYGGLAGSGAQYGLKKTGFFHVGTAGTRKVLVTPEGNAFFQLGICGINLTDDYTQVAGREKTYEWVPSPQDPLFGSAYRPNTPGVMSFYKANWIRKYGKPFDMEEWSEQVVQRLRAWGLNSAGAFSAQTKTMEADSFPYVGFLPIGGNGIKMLPDKLGAGELMDPFEPGTEAALEKIFEKDIAPRANDPLMIGYFQGNEQHMELLPKLIPGYKASKVAAKGRLVETLQQKYGSIDKFNTAWNPEKPFSNWDDTKEALLFVRTESAAADMREFDRLYLDTYYSMVTRVFHKFDPNHLLIGSRWTPATASNEDIVRIGGKYLDVISINYYTLPMEKDFLKKVYDWSGERPILLSEWNYGTTDQGLNGGLEVKDQHERGLAYSNYVEQAAATPYVVGTEWFIYGDQSITGRFFEGFNGEGGNSGFVNVADRPYMGLVEAAGKTHDKIYDVIFGKQPPFAFDDPRFTSKGLAGGGRVVGIRKALPGLKFDGTTTNWPGSPATPIEPSRLVLGTPNPDLRGDFRLCWDEANLYFYIEVKDKTPMMNDQPPGSMWSADCIELFIGPNNLKDGGTMIFSDRQILLGAGQEPKVAIGGHPEESAQCKLLTIKNVAGDGYVLEAVIPWSVLGIKPEADKEMLFDVAIDNSDDGKIRKQQLMWNGSANNGGDRLGWGRAKIVENFHDH